MNRTAARIRRKKARIVEHHKKSQKFQFISSSVQVISALKEMEKLRKKYNKPFAKLTGREPKLNLIYQMRTMIIGKLEGVNECIKILKKNTTPAEVRSPAYYKERRET